MFNGHRFRRYNLFPFPQQKIKGFLALVGYYLFVCGVLQYLWTLVRYGRVPSSLKNKLFLRRSY